MEFFETIIAIIAVAAYFLVIAVVGWIVLWAISLAFSGASLQFAWAKKSNGFVGVIILAGCWIFAWPIMGAWAIAWRWKERANFENKSLIHRMLRRYSKGHDPRY